ncbi:MAG: hypothetical protein K0R38_7550 [Polyangiaceae bacterium]|jgi:hypothetical protein|nr:hypothetical protein [Polyangiaceae bacterium]
MCRRVTCTSCGKPTFVGCGRHIEAVLSDVLPAARCQCRRDVRASERSGREAGKGWLASLRFDCAGTRK